MIKRYEHEYAGDGEYCRSEDVAALEAKHAELIEAVLKLLAIYPRVHEGCITGPTGGIIEALRTWDRLRGLVKEWRGP